MRRLFVGSLILIISQLAGVVFGQNTPTTTSDTTFTAADFYQVVTQHHPLVRQAALLNLEAQQEVRQARGAFDPKLFSTYDRKEFSQNLYYDKWQSGVLVPILPGGIDVKLTYDRNRGEFINPEERVPSSGLAALGVRIPVGRGLLIDARRNALRQAQLALNLADADRLKLINKTLYDAAKTYWEWYLTYQQNRLIQEGYQLADTRYRAVRQRAFLGDAAAIDTTEALITAQDRLVQLRQAAVELLNARLRLTAFLWNSDTSSGTPQPVDLPATVVPQVSPAEQADESIRQDLLNQAAGQHPDLLKLIAKGQQLAVEERFQRSLLQPQISLNATLLSRTPLPGVGYNWSSYYAFRADNHKIGLDLSFPLFLRKERGKLRQVQIKTQGVELERQQAGRDIVNDVQTAWNELKALEGQIEVQQQTVANQRTLLRAEQQKFDLGESSLFLVNSRETKLIDLQLKLEELRTKYQKSIAALWYAAGTHAEAQN
ncbi:MAG: TolC family protein [Cytophagaceae bacterium]|nr:TolC family protein [Cytophagaceae bacterium]